VKELAIKHRNYIDSCYHNRTSLDGTLSTQLTQAYVRETGNRVGHCGSCFINTVIPAYIKLLKEIDE